MYGTPQGSLKADHWSRRFGVIWSSLVSFKTSLVWTMFHDLERKTLCKELRRPPNSDLVHCLKKPSSDLHIGNLWDPQGHFSAMASPISKTRRCLHASPCPCAKSPACWECLTAGKQRRDLFQGIILGAGKLYPHTTHFPDSNCQRKLTLLICSCCAGKRDVIKICLYFFWHMGESYLSCWSYFMLYK